MAKHEAGFSLIEILLAVALVGILSAAVPGALSGASRATITTSEHTTAQSLARSEMDYVQSQPYDSTVASPVYAVITDVPPSYSIDTPVAVRLDPRNDGTANDDGLQQITVTVRRNGRDVYTLVDYKVNIQR